MFSKSGKFSYDPYDAFSLVPLSDSHLILYSVAGTGQPPMQIQNLPDSGFAQPLTLPLYVGGMAGGQPLSGSFTLRWKMKGQLPSGWKIMLMDDAASNATSMTETGELTFQYTTPTDLLPSSSGLLQKKSGGASNQKSIAALTRPVVRTVPATKLSKTSSSVSRFRVIVSANSDLSGYLPTTPNLLQNYPNPFNPATNISFYVPATSRVTIQVFNILGQNITTLTDQEFTAGRHVIVWNANNIASGVYYCRMIAGDWRKTIKTIVLR
jgi:hypothetical protein